MMMMTTGRTIECVGVGIDVGIDLKKHPKS